jgi:predicted peroxiredoxin
MGILKDILGDGDVPAETDRKFAVLLNAGPADTAVAGNGFNYALELDESGYEVQVFLDGPATKWAEEFSENPDRPYHHEWKRIRENGLLAGACGYCADAFDVTEACEMYDVRLLSDKGEHAPAVPTLAAEGYELVTVG